MPNFKFMKHDTWSNALFLHWKIPSYLETVLQKNAYPFVLDRYNKDGFVYVGIILLTEQNVGPSIGRTKYTTITHHGVNVRTYVNGICDRAQQNTHATESNDSSVSSIQPLHPKPKRGIHFSSLECDDELTSYGANLFGMPYKVARIDRTFQLKDRRDDSFSDGSRISIADKGRFVCSKSNSQKIIRYRVNTKRLVEPQPSLLRIASNFLRSLPSSKLHFTELLPSKVALNIDDSKASAAPVTFSVDCTWSVNEEENSNINNPESEKRSPADEDFSQWVVERYFVYTHKYGVNWSGQVEHEPWPLQSVSLEHLKISGVDAYEPTKMQPILQYMAENDPDSVLFSHGVGPVLFNMLRPV